MVEDEETTFEEEKKRYEADPWNYWGNPSSPFAKEERRRRRRAGRPGRLEIDPDDFHERALSEARAVEGGGEGLDAVDGPADEIEALRARLRVALRRQPADTRQLMRSAQELTRMEASARRLSPDKEHELAGNFLAVLNSLNDPRILAPD